MKRRRSGLYLRALARTLVALVGVLAFFHGTDLDVRVQDQLFDQAQRRWWVDAHDPGPRWIFYQGPKGVAILVGVACLGTLLGSWWTGRWRARRRPAAMMLASLALVPAIVAGAKHVPDMHCPCDLQRYGGTMPYIRVLSARPPITPLRPRGKCYPAGHATAGFAFLMLFFLLPERAHWWGLGYGLVMGWVLGSYQMAKGVHFLGDTVASMVGSWAVILGIVEVDSRLGA